MQTKSVKNQLAIYLLLLLVPLFWGGAFGAAEHVVSKISPFTAATIRFASAGLILLMILVARSEWDARAVRKHWRGLLLMSVTGIFLYNAFFFVGLNITSAVNGSLIVATGPVFITLGAVLFLGEAWNGRLIVGLLLSLAGVIFIITNGSWETLRALSFNHGDLLFIGALFSWTANSLIGKVVMKDVSPLLATTVTTLVGSLFLFVGSLFEAGWGKIGVMSVQSWAEMGYMTVFATVIAFVLWNKGIHDVGASKTSLYLNLVPINTTWIAVVIYGASLSWQQLCGMALVIVSVLIATVQPQPALPSEKDGMVVSK